MHWPITEMKYFSKNDDDDLDDDDDDDDDVSWYD